MRYLVLYVFFFLLSLNSWASSNYWTNGSGPSLIEISAIGKSFIVEDDEVIAVLNLVP